jgi:hypothetical protein
MLQKAVVFILSKSMARSLAFLKLKLNHFVNLEPGICGKNINVVDAKV